MSIKEIKEGMEKGKVLFGIKQVLKYFSAKGKEKKNGKVFLVKDAREETAEELEKAGIEFSLIKNKVDTTKELNLNFESEVFLVK